MPRGERHSDGLVYPMCLVALCRVVSMAAHPLRTARRMLECVSLKTGHYILDERGEPKLLKGHWKDTLFEWGHWFETADRKIARDQIGPFLVSTVFLGIDHNHDGKGPPVLWETMIFSDSLNHKWHQDGDRCSGSREQALAMHEGMVQRVRELVINELPPIE